MEHTADRPGSQGGVITAIKNALDALNRDWSEAYLIGHDGEHGWWAARRDQIGALLTATTADELREQIHATYKGQARPPLSRFRRAGRGRRVRQPTSPQFSSRRSHG